MAWSWSHSQEAYENARENLSTLDRETLEIIFAEWRAAQGKGGIIHNHNDFNDNGGFNAWMCPSGCGCHCVSFSPPAEPENEEFEDVELEDE